MLAPELESVIEFLVLNTKLSQIAILPSRDFTAAIKLLLVGLYMMITGSRFWIFSVPYIFFCYMYQ